MLGGYAPPEAFSANGLAIELPEKRQLRAVESDKKRRRFLTTSARNPPFKFRVPITYVSFEPSSVERSNNRSQFPPHFPRPGSSGGWSARSFSCETRVIRDYVSSRSAGTIGSLFSEFALLACARHQLSQAPPADSAVPRRPPPAQNRSPPRESGHQPTGKVKRLRPG